MIGPPPAVNMQFPSLTSVSPSFTAHSSNNLADIAARVVEEFHNDDEDDIYDDMNQLYVPEEHNCMEVLKHNEEEESDDDEEFEFAVSADDIFFDGEILPRYPLFNRSLLLDNVADKSKPNRIISPVVRRPLRKLFMEERELDSCSSSEADDLDGVTPGTYCIWKPKKSNSSNRWKLSLRNLLHRSHSDIDINRTTGNNAPVVVFRTKKRSEKVKKVEKTAKVAGEPVTVADDYKSGNRLKNNNEGNRVRSYLPYKRDLVGVFACSKGYTVGLACDNIYIR